MHSPAGLGKDGKRLWRSITAEFDLEREPHQVQILAQACRVVDVIAAQDEARPGTVDRQGIGGTAGHLAVHRGGQGATCAAGSASGTAELRRILRCLEAAG
jgi:hypothetical protein